MRKSRNCLVPQQHQRGDHEEECVTHFDHREVVIVALYRNYICKKSILIIGRGVRAVLPRNFENLDVIQKESCPFILDVSPYPFRVDHRRSNWGNTAAGGKSTPTRVFFSVVSQGINYPRVKPPIDHFVMNLKKNLQRVGSNPLGFSVTHFTLASRKQSVCSTHQTNKTVTLHHILSPGNSNNHTVQGLYLYNSAR